MGSLCHSLENIGVICVIGAFIPTLDRYFININLDFIQLGLYSVGFKIANILRLTIQAFQTAWGPFYLSIFKEKDSTETYNQVLYVFTYLICFLILFVTFISEPLISFLASEKYLLSSQIIFHLAFGIGMTAIGWITSIGIDLSKNTFSKILGVILRLIIQAIIIIQLIKPLGILGVAIGVMFGQIINIISDFYFGFKQYHLRFELKNVFFLIVLTVLIFFFDYSINFQNFNFVILFRIFLITLFLFIGHITAPSKYNFKLWK